MKCKWYETRKVVPSVSGQYLCYHTVEDCDSGYFTIMNYSAKYRAFNAYDDLELVEKHVLHPYAWTFLPEEPCFDMKEG